MAPIPRGRSPYRTPQSTRKRRRSKSKSRSSGSSKGGMSISPGTVENLVSLATGDPVAGAVANVAVQAARSRSRSRSRVRFGGTTIGGEFGGKLSSRSKVHRGKKYKGIFTSEYMRNNGIQHSKEVSSTGPTIVNCEVFGIGHCSIPQKQTYVNMWRAIFKHIYNRMQIMIKDYTYTMVSVGFQAGDAFRIVYYNGFTATTASSVSQAIGALSTFDDYAVAFAKLVADTVAATNLAGIRWESLDFVPLNSNTPFARRNLDLQHMKVFVKSKSHLKYQNQTVFAAGDDEADVNNIPLQGKSYLLRGTNAFHETNRKMLPYVENGQTMFLDTWDKSVPTVVGTNVGAVTVASSNLSEIPKGDAFLNCYKTGKIRINPGKIQTSSLYEYKQDFFTSWLRKFLYHNAFATDLYNPSLGKSRLLMLEKVIGFTDATRGMKISYELNLEQEICCFAKHANVTAMIQEQTQS